MKQENGRGVTSWCGTGCWGVYVSHLIFQKTCPEFLLPIAESQDKRLACLILCHWNGKVCFNSLYYSVAKNIFPDGIYQ